VTAACAAGAAARSRKSATARGFMARRYRKRAILFKRSVR
jgi:hypothetical protein